MAATAEEAIVLMIRASSEVTALCPAASIFHGELPIEVVLPMILVEGTLDSFDPLLPKSQTETHRFTITARCKQVGAGEVRPLNPAGRLIDRVEAAINWTDLSVPGFVPITLWSMNRRRSIERQLAPDGERVFRAILEAVLEVGREK